MKNLIKKNHKKRKKNKKKGLLEPAGSETMGWPHRSPGRKEKKAKKISKETETMTHT